MSSQFISDYKAEIQQRIRDTEQSLGNGGAGDYAEYQRKVGLIQGLKASHNMLVDAWTKFTHEEDL